MPTSGVNVSEGGGVLTNHRQASAERPRIAYKGLRLKTVLHEAEEVLKRKNDKIPLENPINLKLTKIL